MGKFVINDAKNGVKFNLKAGNGEIIAHSVVYSSLASCKKGIASVIKNAPIAAVEDQTKEGFAKERNPKFEIYADKKGEFRFRLRARNGQNIAASEGYTTMKACQNGIESVRKNAAEGNKVLKVVSDAV